MSALPEVVIQRDPSGPDGTFGKLTAPAGFQCYTLEKPDKGNEPQTSCIPAGTYRVEWRTDSPAHGEVYELKGVAGRTNIQIHSANCEDELLGCIALGRAIMEKVERKGKPTRKGVTSSRDAIAAFVAQMSKLPFRLTIRNAKEAA